MNKEQTMVISVMDRDRPGIVAEVTEGISALGGNLSDLRESVLCGYFTMILVASFPTKRSMQEIKETLSKKTASHVSVTLHEGSFLHEQEAQNTYVLSAVGRNRVGLVAQVSRFCCDRGVNVLDMASHVEGDQYTMMLQIDLTPIQSLEKFKADLSAFGITSDLHIALQHNDIFRATNEI